jgi:hypothetical protein
MGTIIEKSLFFLITTNWSRKTLPTVRQYVRPSVRQFRESENWSKEKDGSV